MIRGATLVALLAGAAAAQAPEEAGAPPALPFRRAPLEGYAGRTSVRPGETIEFFVSCTQPSYDLEIVRIGAPDTVVQRLESLPGVAQGASTEVVREGCGWRASFRVPVPPSWSSGLYLARLHALLGTAAPSYDIPFVVRSAAPGVTSRVLTLAPDLTAHAFNAWGGDGVEGAAPREVSLDRPHEPGGRSSLVSRWDLPFLRWVEHACLDPLLPALDYASDVDLHLERALLDRYDLLLLFGHHGFWTREMRDAVDAFVRNGGNVLAVGGDVGTRPVVLDATGRRVRRLQIPWHGPPHHRPPERTFGLGFRQARCAGSARGELCPPFPLEGRPSDFPFAEGFGHFRVAQPRHPLFAGHAGEAGTRFGVVADGSGVRVSSLLGSLDGANLEAVAGGRVASTASGAPRDLLVLADAPTRYGFAAVATHADGGTVVHAGSPGLRAAASGAPPVPAVQELLASAFRTLAFPRRNRVANGGFERWDGEAPAGFATSGDVSRSTSPLGRGSALRLTGRPAFVWQRLQLPERGPAERLHVIVHVRADWPGARIVLRDGDTLLLDAPLEPGPAGFRHAACDVPPDLREVTLLIEKRSAGPLTLDGLEVLTDAAFARSAWELARTAATTTRLAWIDAGRHAGGAEVLVLGHVRGSGELYLVDQDTEERAGALAVAAPDWEPVVFTAALPGRGRLPRFLVELAPGSGATLEVRDLSVLPLGRPAPPPPRRIRAASDDLEVAASERPQTITRELDAIAAGRWFLSGWARGATTLRIVRGDETLFELSADTIAPTAWQHEVELPDLPAGAGSVEVTVPAGRDAALTAVRLRPKAEVLWDDLVSNGAFELAPSDEELARGLDWSDRPPGWSTLGDTRLMLDPGMPWDGRRALRIDPGESVPLEGGVEGGALYLLPEHLPLERPLRLHARVRTASGARAALALVARTPDGSVRVLARTELAPGEAWREARLFVLPDGAPPSGLVRGWVRVEVAGGAAWLDDLVVEADARAALTPR